MTAHSDYAMSRNLERLDDAALLALLEHEATEREAELRFERIGDIWRVAFVARDPAGTEVTLRSVAQPSRRQALLRLAEFVR